MDYKNIYNRLIAGRRKNTPSGYVEKHHVVPRCMGGGDGDDNIVKLTAKEHYVAHHLLCKIYPNNPKLWGAFAAMVWWRGDHQKRYIPSRIYHILKTKHSEFMSESQTGNKNSNFGTIWVSDYEKRISKKVHRDTKLEPNWHPGRVLDWDNHFSQRQCSVCGKKGCMSTQSKFCSASCKNSAIVSYLDGRENEFLIRYKETRSMNKALKAVGARNAGGYIRMAVKVILASKDDEIISIYYNNKKPVK